MRLLAEVHFPLWRLRTPNERRGRNYRVIEKWDTPPCGMRIVCEMDGARVAEPHAKRLVVVARFGPRELDDDGLHGSIKPALDYIKARQRGKVGGVFLNYINDRAFIYDDSPKYCESKPRQVKSAEYGARVMVYDPEG